MQRPVQPPTKSDFERIGQARVFFSHHSVGGNLLDGMAQLSAANGGSFKRVPLDEAKGVEGPAWVEGVGGRNGDPQAKIDFFAETIRSRPHLRPKLAFMKFCYVDFNPATNVDELFTHYQKTLEALKAEHPAITFAHVTAPLMARPADLKSRVQRLVGRPVWEDDANVKREQFNQRLLRTFSSDPIFDLARAESTREDGTRTTFAAAGAEIPSLDPAYTEDGGHLNERGRRVIGGQMITFTASALALRP